MSVKVERLTKETCIVGEAPHWDDKTQSLLFVDVDGFTCYKWKDGYCEGRTFDDKTSILIPTEDGRYVATLGRKLICFDWEEHNHYEVLDEVEQGTKNQFNDGKCDATGRLYVGTTGPIVFPIKHDHKGALYSYEKDGRLHTRLPHVTMSNGLAWSSDNQIMYYIDSMSEMIQAFDYDITSGAISNGRKVVSVKDPQLPDGMCIDTQGNLWVALFTEGKVARFDPRTGQELEGVSIPTAKETTSCCFGGRYMDELYVTTMKRDVITPEQKKEQPDAGACFRVTGLGVKGRPAHAFSGPTFTEEDCGCFGGYFHKGCEYVRGRLCCS